MYSLESPVYARACPHQAWSNSVLVAAELLVVAVIVSLVVTLVAGSVVVDLVDHVVIVLFNVGIHEIVCHILF